MPIPLGILAAAGFRPEAAGDFVLLDQRVLTTAEASVVFSGLGTYSGTYKHLQIRMASRITESVGYPLAESYIQFNGITTNSYAWHWLYSNGSGSPVSQGVTNTNRLIAGRVTSNNGSASAFGATVIDILDPFVTSKNTTTRSLSGVEQSGGGLGDLRGIHLTSGLFNSTAAISSISLLPNSANWAADSRFSLYGVK